MGRSVECGALRGFAFYFFILPADEVSLVRVEVHADDVDVPFVQEVFFSKL